MRYKEQYLETKLYSMLTLSSSGKDMIFGPIEYSPNGKSIMAPMEHNPMVYRLNEKGMAL